MARKKDTIIKCVECNSEKIIMEFYSSNSKLHDVFPICKKCIEKIYGNLLANYKSNMLALIHLCIYMDFPFDFDLAQNNIAENGELDINVYLKDIEYSMGKRAYSSVSKTMMDNIDKYKIGAEAINEDEDVLSDFKVTSEIYRRWGTDYNKSELFFLEGLYEDLVKSFGGVLPTEKSLYKNYALNELGMKRALEDGKDDIYIKYQNAQSKLMADARLKPTQNTTENTDDFLVGVFIKNIEENRPIAEVSPEFEDVDKIGKIIQEEFVDKLSRSIGGSIK